MSRNALVIGIVEYQHFIHLPGANVDAEQGATVFRSLGFDVDVLVGSVSLDRLSSSVDAFLEKVSKVAQEHREPIVAVCIAGHGVQPSSCDPTFPELLATDTPCLPNEGAVAGYDVRENMVSKLNDMRARSGGALQVLMIFDCCRQNVGSTCWRSPAVLGSLRNDFYMIFACDPGRRARDTEQGGKLMVAVLELLPYALPITQILEEAARRTLASSIVLQRPWVHHRIGVRIPVFGKQPGPLPAPSECATDAGAARDDTVMDRAVVLLVGSTGHGKSSLGNMLLGRQAFVVSDGEESATMHAQLGDSIQGQWPCRVIDTVGFRGTGLSAEQHLDRFTEFADLVPHGIDSFLLVMSAAGGLVTTSQSEILRAFCEAVGEDALQFTIVVFTFAGSGPLRGAEDAMHYCRNSSNVHLRAMAEQVQGVVAIDLAGQNSDANEVQRVVGELQRFIGRGAASKYQNVVLQAALARRQELQTVTQQLVEERQQHFRSRIDDVYCGRAACADVLREAWSALETQEREQVQQRELQRRFQRLCEHLAEREQAAQQLHVEQRRRRARAVFHGRYIHVSAPLNSCESDAKQHAREALFNLMFD